MTAITSPNPLMTSRSRSRALRLAVGFSGFRVPMIAAIARDLDCAS
jgi:hypothetical protein